MTTDTRSGEGPELSAAALDAWSRHVDAVLQGIAHALNNRAAALSAAVQLARDDGSASVVDGVLAPELERITELAAAVRTLGAPRGGVEAFSPKDAAAEAAAVLKLHAAYKTRVVAIEARGAAPVRLHRWMFVRALIALTADTTSDGDVRVTVEDDRAGDWVAVRANAATPSAYVSELAVAMGGEAASDGFRVPTLAALRRREGR